MLPLRRKKGKTMFVNIYSIYKSDNRSLDYNEFLICTTSSRIESQTLAARKEHIEQIINKIPSQNDDLIMRRAVVEDFGLTLTTWGCRGRDFIP